MIAHVLIMLSIVNRQQWPLNPIQLTLASSPPPLAPGAALPVKLQPRTAQPLAQLSCSVAPPPPPPLPALAADAAATRAARNARN